MKWPSIDPGRLRHQITILRPVSSSGTAGPKTTFEPFITTYAAIEPVSGSDVIASGQTVSEMPLPITINWQAGIESNMRVRALGGTYIIREVINEQQMNVTLTLLCVALKGNQ